MSVTREDRDDLARLLTSMRNAIAERMKAEDAYDAFWAEHSDRIEELKRTLALCRELEFNAVYVWNTTAPSTTLRVIDTILSQQVTP